MAKILTEAEMCENCGEIKLSKDINICIMCGKHICSACSYHYFHESVRDRYPDIYCQVCWDIGKPYRVEINKSELEHDIRKEKIISDWFDKINEIKLERIPPLICDCKRYKLSCKYGIVKYHLPGNLSDNELKYYHSTYKKGLYEKYIMV